MNYLCPVCFFDQMPYPPRHYNICPCCGTEFDNDDADYSYEELRTAWIKNGAQWFYEQPPAGWNPWLQLIDGGRADLVPLQQVPLYMSAWGNVGSGGGALNESNVIESPHEDAEAFSMVG